MGCADPDPVADPGRVLSQRSVMCLIQSPGLCLGLTI